MSVSFIGAPEDGRLVARNFSGFALPPRNSSAVPTMVTMRPPFAVNACTPCVLLVVLVYSNDVLKFTRRWSLDTRARSRSSFSTVANSSLLPP